MDLATLLDVERLDRDLFRGQNAASPMDRLYGGQVAAQALRAAGATVGPDRVPHSLHGYFLRPGRTNRPVLLQVDRDRDGGSFSSRHVSAIQEGEVIFSMLASFQRPAESGELDAVPTRTPPPPERGYRNWDGMLEVRELAPTQVTDDRILYLDGAWIRSLTPLPDSPLVRACALTYASDLGSGFGQITDPALINGGPSIDHAMWFHHDIPVDEWVHLDMAPIKATGRRGVYMGAMRSEDGRLGALLTQEMLLRASQPEEREQMRAALAARRQLS